MVNIGDIALTTKTSEHDVMIYLDWSMVIREGAVDKRTMKSATSALSVENSFGRWPRG